MTVNQINSHLCFPADDQNLLQSHTFLFQNQAIKQLDLYTQQKKELFLAINPQSSSEECQLFLQKSEPLATQGSWVYYPWKQSLVHILGQKEYYQLRTNRNYPLIQAKHQKKIAGLTIGVVGLSVGSHVAMALAHSGIGNHYKLADPDELSLSNMNRMYESLLNIGANKSVLITRKLAELDPYLKLEAFHQGLSRQNFESFFKGSAPLDLIVDECDDLMLKLYLRLAARALGIPLLMITDNGFTVDVSVLRFDTKAKNSFSDFPPLSFEEVVAAYQVSEQPNLSLKEQHSLLYEILGDDGITPEMKDSISLREKGKIASWPQLGMVAAAGGGIGAYVASLLFDNRLKAEEKFSISFPAIFSQD